MAIVKTIKKGESLSFGFAFPDTYDITRLQNVKVYIGSSVYTHSMDGQKIRVVLRSNDTKLLTGTNVINLLVDDSVFGIRKVDYGALQILPTQAVFSDESFNAGYDFLIPLIVTENTISVENVLYSVIEGKAATIAVGTVTTLAAGEDATVENVGDENEAVFNFGIPQGIQGERGLQGYTPYIGENGNWFINGVDTGVQAEGDATQQWVIDNFVVKESGKSLIADTEIARLATVTNQTKQTLGLENVDNTSDAAKPISTATQTALNGKVNTTDIEQVRSQATNKVASSKLLDDELTKVTNTERPIADILAHLLGRIQTLEGLLTASAYNTIQVNELSVVENIKLKGADKQLFGTGAPTVTPDFEGQEYLDQSAKIWYDAVGVVNAGDWKPRTNS